MLDVALKFLTEELNSYLFTRTGSEAVSVKPGRLVEDTGKYANEPNCICTTLVHIEQERIVKAQPGEGTHREMRALMKDPELRLNLIVLFAANLRSYEDSLKYISHILAFFHSQSLFSRSQFPTLDPRIEKLVLELQSLGYEQLNQIWGFIGARQVPSLVYRVKMVVLETDNTLIAHGPARGSVLELSRH